MKRDLISLVSMLVVGFSSFYLGMESQARTDSAQTKDQIALTARFVYLNQCSQMVADMIGQGQNQMFQTKEQMIMNLICAQKSEQLSNFLLDQPKIKEDNIVLFLDKAFSSIQVKESKNTSETEDIKVDNNTEFI